ncbi:MAG: type 4a pilus biogenesis protein PilO [Candidatus Omnitrophica bacterium]|nr:type 4a pilus biogenesis protein PilO [Candidatus Omnitrophota bacterium]
MPPPKPPPQKITNLRQIDIAKLDVKDLQNIDYQKLLKDVRKRPDTAISFAAPILALFICFNMFTKFQAEQKSLSRKIKEMSAKAKQVDDYNAAQAEFDNFKKALPPTITENEFLNKITDLAVKNDIQIESYVPGQSKTDPIYDITNINLVASANDFNAMGHFISDIENSGLAIRINSWSGTMGARTQSAANRRASQKGNMGELVINFRMDISSVTFKL